MKQRIPIFFATDDNYFPFLCVTLASIEEYANDSYIYDVKILTTSLSEENEKRAKNLGFPHIVISVVNLEERVGKIRSKITERLRDYYSESIFYRIFIPSLFKELDKAIYLDCDIVLKDDVAKLYFTDIEDNVLGAVADESIAPIPEFCTYVDKVVGSPEGIYINSGVLLINAKKFREERIEEKLVHLIEKYNFKTVAPDQDYLNFLCKDKIYYFDAGWNKQPNQNTDFPEEKIHLIHFNMFNKPWHYYDVKYEEYFWAMAKKTPYYEALLEEKSRYTDKEREEDMLGAQKLISGTVEIFNEKCSFLDVIDRSYFNGADIL